MIRAILNRNPDSVSRSLTEVYLAIMSVTGGIPSSSFGPFRMINSDGQASQFTIPWYYPRSIHLEFFMSHWSRTDSNIELEGCTFADSHRRGNCAWTFLFEMESRESLRRHKTTVPENLQRFSRLRSYSHRLDITCSQTAHCPSKSAGDNIIGTGSHYSDTTWKSGSRNSPQKLPLKYIYTKEDWRYRG